VNFRARPSDLQATSTDRGVTPPRPPPPPAFSLFGIRPLTFILVAVALGALALYTELAWGLLGGWPAIRVGTTIDAKWIRAHYPLHLISPDWIPASGAGLLRLWRMAEFWARSALVFGAWLACLFFSFRWARRHCPANPPRPPPR
jgi:hypothetical protein